MIDGPQQNTNSTALADLDTPPSEAEHNVLDANNDIGALGDELSDEHLDAFGPDSPYYLQSLDNVNDLFDGFDASNDPNLGIVPSTHVTTDLTASVKIQEIIDDFDRQQHEDVIKARELRDLVKDVIEQVGDDLVRSDLEAFGQAIEDRKEDLTEDAKRVLEAFLRKLENSGPGGLTDADIFDLFNDLEEIVQQATDEALPDTEQVVTWGKEPLAYLHMTVDMLESFYGAESDQGAHSTLDYIWGDKDKFIENLKQLLNEYAEAVEAELEEKQEQLETADEAELERKAEQIEEILADYPHLKGNDLLQNYTQNLGPEFTTRQLLALALVYERSELFAPTS
ncbi:hypothetical protein OAO01_01375 [Oligoflexia bacterium]|nr:hypothetical protein [Oligoflexia bacterium]